MNSINVVVIDQNRPETPESAAWLDEEHHIHVAARSTRLDDTGTLCASHHPDVLLVSTRCLPDSGTGWLTEVRRQSATTRVLLTGDALAEQALVDCLGTGARGWVEASDAPLVGKAVQAVHLGEAWVSRKMARQLVDRLIDRERDRAG